MSGRYTSVESLAENDFRRRQPRFQGDNLDANLRLVERVKAIADELGCTPAQLALAWLLHQGHDIVPIPGTKRVRYLEENAAAAGLALAAEQLAALDEALPAGAAAGDRYPAESMRSVER